jgi:hypothetical protein
MSLVDLLSSKIANGKCDLAETAMVCEYQLTIANASFAPTVILEALGFNNFNLVKQAWTS